MSGGTLALSWGRYGGFYARRAYCWRICLGVVALTYCPVEIDDLMAAYADFPVGTQETT